MTRSLVAYYSRLTARLCRTNGAENGTQTAAAAVAAALVGVDADNAAAEAGDSAA